VYTYGEPVLTSHDEAHLLPRPTDRQVLHGLELQIHPTPDTVAWHRDYFGNDVVFFALHEPHERLSIRTDSRVDVRPAPPPETTRSPAWETVPPRVRGSREESALAAYEFIFPSPNVPRDEALAAYARPSFEAGRPLAEAVLDLSHRIHEDFTYDPEATTLATPVLEALRERHGVCQDYAHVMIGALRSLGLPARYVSGYLRSPGLSADGAADGAGEPSLVGAEASHAWVQVWCPELGWLDIDPTNDRVPSDRHVVLGWGRDYDDVSPVKGVTLGGGVHAVEVSVSVRPAAETGGADALD
jgi:transglutaminase-like putative cysteine protease